MIQRKDWNEFRKTGLLFLINTMLHAFGWAIVFEVDDDDNVRAAYPARVKFRGFSEDIASEAYVKISSYIL